MLGCGTPPAVTLKAEKSCYFANPHRTADIITAVDSSLGNRNEWASLLYYYYFWHRQPHTCRCSADRGSLPRWQQCYNLLYNKHIFQALQPSLASPRVGTRAKQCITSHRLTFNACIPHSQLSLKQEHPDPALDLLCGRCSTFLLAGTEKSQGGTWTRITKLTAK